MLDLAGQKDIFGRALTGQEKAMLKNHPMMEEHWDRKYQLRESVREIMHTEDITWEAAEKRVKRHA